MVLQLDTVVDVVGTVGEETDVAMVGMLAPWLMVIFGDPLFPVTWVLGERCGVEVCKVGADVTEKDAVPGSLHLCNTCLL